MTRPAWWVRSEHRSSLLATPNGWDAYGTWPNGRTTRICPVREFSLESTHQCMQQSGYDMLKSMSARSNFVSFHFVAFHCISLHSNNFKSDGNVPMAHPAIWLLTVSKVVRSAFKPHPVTRQLTCLLVEQKSYQLTQLPNRSPADGTPLVLFHSTSPMVRLRNVSRDRSGRSIFEGFSTCKIRQIIIFLFIRCWDEYFWRKGHVKSAINESLTQICRWIMQMLHVIFSYFYLAYPRKLTRYMFYWEHDQTPINYSSYNC